jgi:hypothetical protein
LCINKKWQIKEENLLLEQFSDGLPNLRKKLSWSDKENQLPQQHFRLVEQISKKKEDKTDFPNKSNLLLSKPVVLNRCAAEFSGCASKP